MIYLLYIIIIIEILAFIVALALSIIFLYSSIRRKELIIAQRIFHWKSNIGNNFKITHVALLLVAFNFRLC
jgi:hypothetical protein